MHTMIRCLTSCSWNRQTSQEAMDSVDRGASADHCTCTSLVHRNALQLVWWKNTYSHRALRGNGIREEWHRQRGWNFLCISTPVDLDFREVVLRLGMSHRVAAGRMFFDTPKTTYPTTRIPCSFIDVVSTRPRRVHVFMASFLSNCTGAMVTAESRTV